MVQVDIGGHKYDMIKDESGLWSVVTPPLVVGFHYYALVVDGVSVADPASESFFGVSKMMSGIEVPSLGEDFYDVKDVPHGEVREHWYYSSITEHGVGGLSTLRQIMIAARQLAILCSISSTVPVKMNAAGVCKVGLISFSII